jgi:hypothetical protein
LPRLPSSSSSSSAWQSAGSSIPAMVRSLVISHYPFQHFSLLLSGLRKCKLLLLSHEGTWYSLAPPPQTLRPILIFSGVCPRRSWCPPLPHAAFTCCHYLARPSNKRDLH